MNLVAFIISECKGAREEADEAHKEWGDFRCFLGVDYYLSFKHDEFHNWEKVLSKVKHHSFDIETRVEIRILNSIAAKLIDILVELL